MFRHLLSEEVVSEKEIYFLCDDFREGRDLRQVRDFRDKKDPWDIVMRFREPRCRFELGTAYLSMVVRFNPPLLLPCPTEDEDLESKK